MTNTNLLEKIMREKRITKAFLAEHLGITRQGLYKKINNKSEFKQSEIEKITKLLCLDNATEKAIFYDVR